MLALRTGIKDVLKQGYKKMEHLKLTRAKLKRKNMFSNNLGETTLSTPPAPKLQETVWFDVSSATCPF